VLIRLDQSIDEALGTTSLRDLVTQEPAPTVAE